MVFKMRRKVLILFLVGFLIIFNLFTHEEIHARACYYFKGNVTEIRYYPKDFFNFTSFGYIICETKNYSEGQALFDSFWDSMSAIISVPIIALIGYLLTEGGFDYIEKRYC